MESRAALRAALTLLLGAGCFGWGFYAGRGSREDLRAERRAALAVASRADAPAATFNAGSCAVAVDPQLLRAELAKALQAAGIQATGAGAAAAASNSPLPSEASPPSPEQIAAFDRARAAVDGALARGNMTATEARDLRGLMAELAPDSRQELTLRLVRAMNRDQVAFEEHQLPF